MANNRIIRKMYQEVLLNSMGIITSRPKFVNFKSEVKPKGTAYVSKVNLPKTATALKHERIAKRARAILQKRGCRPGEDKRNWQDVLLGIISRITSRSKIVSFKSEVKPKGPAYGSKVNLPRPTTALTHELITERARIIWQKRGCRPGEDERNWIEAETQLMAELGID